MSAAPSPSLLTFQGDVSIHYLDGTVIEGEFITQDIYNIFLTVEGERLMIPRAQIRYIKAAHSQQITVDNSQEKLATAVMEEEDPTSPGGTRAPAEDATFEMPSLKVETEEEKEDGTVILPADAPSVFSVEQEEEEDKTFILPPNTGEFSSDENEDEDVTFVLPPEGIATYKEEEEEDGTVVLPASALEGYEAEEDEEDSTVVITQGELPQITVKLTCTAGPHTGQIFAFTEERITVGRSTDNMVVLSGDKEISRHHAIIYQDAGQYVIKDQDSLNGTFVNNEPAAQPHPLKPGDEILVGISLLKYQEA